MAEEIKPRKKSRTLGYVGIILILIGFTFGLMYSINVLEQTESVIDLKDIPEDEILKIVVTDQPPYALDHRETDFVKEHMNHAQPSIQDFQETLIWAKTLDKEELMRMQHEILEGAKQNQNIVSNGEKSMLDIITWSAFPEMCEKQTMNCKFMNINYYEGLYQNGTITRDEYWQNIKQYASQETIDKVEGKLTT